MERFNKKSMHERTNVRTYKRTNLISGLYTIVDSGFNPFGSASDLARRYLEGGARIIQLRMKDSGPGTRDPEPGTIRDSAIEIMKLKSEFDFTFIVNDHVDVAIEIGADGVHVGENDEAVDSIRGRAPEDMLIGYSSHSVGEALEAERRGADYVAFGAVFPTRTKGPGHPVQGLDRLAEVARSAGVPVVAIGGIGRDNLERVIEAGADSVAVITALSMAPDATAETRWFVERLSVTGSR